MNRLTKLLLSSLTFLVLSACGGGGGSSSTFACGDSTGVYVRTDGINSNPGTISLPLQTIQAAVGCGQSGQTIRVANGTYKSAVSDDGSIAGWIVLAEGKSIYGGYSSDFQVRAPSVYPTIITDVTDMSLNPFGWSAAVIAMSETTSTTVFDGFTVNGTTVGIGGLVTAVQVSGSATISNNIINGGGNSSTDQSQGVYLEYGTNPIVINNTIDGGNSSSNSWGVRSYANGPVTISNNTINGGLSGSISYAIEVDFLSTAGSIISNNSISGGDGTWSSYGIKFNAAAPIIVEANTIASGGGSMSYGINSERGVPVIRNNTIILEGETSYGIYNVSNSVISNNTIVGGGSSDSWGIYTKLATAAIFQNNIIDIMSGTCVAEDDANSDPAILKNNNLTGCTNLYYDEGTTNITSILSVNALSITDASDNISEFSSLDDTKDYQLTMSSPTVVTQGGLDLSSDFNTDKAGNSRTVPWSIGAYEYD